MFKGAQVQEMVGVRGQVVSAAPLWPLRIYATSGTTRRSLFVLGPVPIWGWVLMGRACRRPPALDMRL